MNCAFFLCIVLAVLLLWSTVTEGGILKGRRKGHDDDAVETLLAVGLIAKALSDNDKGNQCPPPVTKIIHVPVHTERIYVVKENSKDEALWSESNKNIWKDKVNSQF